ncbi:Uncharacterised protein [uncultured archaeon]|nr:Uncharacterised protein [uncultured archaeon]
MKLSAISSSTKILLGETHTCPQFMNLPQTAPFIASSMLAYLKTIKASLPPNSRDIRCNFSAEFFMIFLPVSALPVKDTIFISELTRHSPVLPSPVTTFITPSGIPASWHILPISIPTKGVRSEGFKTTVLPASSAGAIAQKGSSIG